MCSKGNLPQKYDIVVYRKMLGKHNKRWLNSINQVWGSNQIIRKAGIAKAA